MVLEDASATPDFVSDSSPTSDNDPYSSSNGDTSSPNPTGGILIDMRTFPRGMPIFGPLFGYTPSLTSATINKRIVTSSQLLQRPVTPDEATALAFWTCKGVAIASWGQPLGCLWGGYRTYSTRANYKFPFVTPSADKFNPNTFLGILHGQQAQLGWHCARFTAYTIWGGFVAGLFFTTYGAVSAAVGEHQDPRLKDLIKAIKTKAHEAVGGVQGRRGRQPVGLEGDPTGQGQTTMPELWKNHREAIGDDASPTGGYNDTEDGASLAQSGDGMLSDQQMRTQEQRQQASPGRSRTENRASTFEVEKVAPQPTIFDDFDDASPTAGQGSVNAGSGGGSAWGRIRNQASSQGGTRAGKRISDTQQERMEGSTTGDSFAFSETDSDKQLAKHEAQREFDERVERERRGGDFGAGRGGR